MYLITFAVPCYNSAGYMRRCIDTLLTGGEDVEIIIVNDGSTDETGKIAEEYAERFPNVTAVNQENGGHGSGVNKGLELAQGLYFKVVDSDDWLETAALHTLLDTLWEHLEQDTPADLYLTNFVYEKVVEHARFVRRYTENFPQGRLFGWNEVKRFRNSNVLLMHSMLYRTDKLRESGVVLPEHTFYVDNIFAYKPLPYTKKLYYMNIDLYRYYIGREDQSVNRENIVKRYRQQIRVMKEMLNAYSYRDLNKLRSGLSQYMKHDLGVVMTLTMMFTTGGKENIAERKIALKELWENLRRKDEKMYSYLRRSYPALVNWLPFRLCGTVMSCGYKFFRNKLKCS